MNNKKMKYYLLSGTTLINSEEFLIKVVVRLSSGVFQGRYIVFIGNVTHILCHCPKLF